MHKLFGTISLLAALLFSSCFSSITVRVHSFDMDKMKSSPEYQRQNRERELMTYNILINGNYFDRVKTQLLDQVRDSLQHSTNVDPAAIPEVVNNLKPRLDQILDPVKASTIAVRDALANYVNSTTDNLKKTYDIAFAD